MPAGDVALEARVRALLASILEVECPPEPLSRDACAAWDSLKHIEVVFALEDEFAVRFDEAEFASMTSTDVIAGMIDDRLGS